MFDEKREEDKLINEAVGMKGSGKMEQQLAGEASADGFNTDQVRAIIARVLERVKGTETGQQSNAFGKPHKADDRYVAIKQAMNRNVI
jgi:hypothetical protein